MIGKTELIMEDVSGVIKRNISPSRINDSAHLNGTYSIYEIYYGSEATQMQYIHNL